ncbi:hypothetical protein ABH947_002766 [Bacillus sp. RC206]
MGISHSFSKNITCTYMYGGNHDDMIWYDIVLRLFIAIIVGACIGMERQWRHRMAGPSLPSKKEGFKSLKPST